MHVKWQRYQFHVKDKWLREAQYIDKEECGGWSVNFADQSEQAFHAHIFRAAYRYYYQDINGLRRPPTNGFWSERMQIRAYYENNDEGNGFHKEERRILGNWIKMYNPFRTEESIFSTTLHELAHASHWHLKHSDFDDTDSKVKESWARGVQWSLTTIVYPTYKGGGTSRPNYTQVVVDMVDGRAPLDALGNPIDINVGSEKLTEDDVDGYTIRQIEDALIGRKTWNSWRDNIINKYDNATEGKLTTLFSHWD